MFIILGKLPTLNLPIKKSPILKVAIFSDSLMLHNLSVKLPWLQERGNELNTTISDRYNSQSFKAITFQKMTNHAKVYRVKQINVPGHLDIF